MAPPANPFGAALGDAAAAPARLVCPFMGTVGKPEITGRVQSAGGPQVRVVPVNMYCQEDGCMFWHRTRGVCALRAAADGVLELLARARPGESLG